ncbi:MULTISPECIES: ComEC/Rec2 family competence protein [Streptomyces]|uniref:Competence protein ComEC n=1 Tax=Streptomyces clavifer TaxID=68188 RepID=A0ABS4VC05_9ACTN|nr:MULTISPECIES: ComEC/Rec2 family competence protein [Streptomyces]MBP2361445.1 competence protein ComEC [Streptomyces clavifer]MDX2744174.1 ComEC/Rec2 family competence protein [Streptomyces sp. NRRL_B-2557]GHA92773.1 membrane protein [Streptomyces clavifer]
MTGPDVHTASGRRLGSADPRQEGPVDLRLVPPALATWAAAGLTLGVSGRWAAAGAVLCACAALALLAGPRVVAAARARRTGVAGRAPGGQPHARLRTTAAAGVLLCAAAGATVAGLHGADTRSGPVPGLAEEYTRVEAEVTVTSDPRKTRPRVRGDHSTPVSLLLDAEVDRLTGPDGTVSRLRTPVLVMVSPGAAAAEWQRLLPSTGLRVSGRLSPPRHEGERIAAVLGTDADGPPQVIAAPTLLQRTAGDLRSGLRKATDGLDPDARALLPGLVVGDTSRVTPELHDAFKATDLTHLLAVSGANLSILLFLLIGPPGTALRSERRGLAPRLGISLRMTALIGGGIALAFVIVCRPEPSVLRAAACGLITLLAIGTGRRRSLIPALAAAVLLLVLYDPWLARSYGFLLSVLATGALLTLAPRWAGALQRHRVPPRLAEVLAAAGAAQAVCAPIVVVLASRVSLVAIPCNLLAEFAVAPATVLGFAALAVAPVSMPAAEALALVAGWPVGWIASVARTGAALPGAEADWPGGWEGAALLAVLTTVLVLSVRRLARHPWVCSAAALLLVLAVLRPVPLTRIMTGWPPPDWAFALCDVGQGDAMVLAAGEGTGVVVDTGPDPRLIDGCLRELGITRVPLLLLTHFHADHVRGLPGALRGRDVATIQTTSLGEPADQAAFVRRTAATAHVPVVPAVPGERRRIGPLDWRVLWPTAGTGGAVPAFVTEEPNDSSVTLFVRSGGLTLLLLGDLEPPAQRGMLRSYPALPRVDVLKVAHHGSAYQDAALLRSVRPRLALVSCGTDNPYGHPAATTLETLRAGGAEVLRTDTDGAIAVTGAGAGLRAEGRS